MEDRIIRYLKEFPAGKIYLVSPRDCFVFGYKYYKAGSLFSFAWSDNRKILNAVVQGEHEYKVSFFIEGNELRYKCSCSGWRITTNCEHVVCALLTTKNILDPALFNVGRQSEVYRDLLGKFFLSPNTIYGSGSNATSKVSIYSILLSKLHYCNNFEISIQRADSPVSPYSYNVPKELRNLASISHNYYNGSSRALHQYLQDSGNIHPLLLHIDDKSIPLEWDDDLIFAAKTGIDVTQGRVTLDKLCIFNDDGPCLEPYQLSDNFLVDLRSGKLAFVDDNKGWDLWRQFHGKLGCDAGYTYGDMDDIEDIEDIDGDIDIDDDYYTDGYVDSGRIEPRTVPLKTLQNRQLIAYGEGEEAIKDLILSIDRENVSPLQAEQSYSMVIDTHDREKGRIILRAHCNLSDLNMSTTETFFGFLLMLAQGSDLSGPLRAKKRRAAMIEVFMGLLSTKGKSTAEKFIRKSLSNGGDFTKRKIKSEAKQLLSEAFLWLNKKTSRIQFYNHKWCFTSNNKDKESLLYTVPFELFGHTIFMDMNRHNEMIVSANDFYSQLTVLHLKLEEHGIPLLFSDKPIQMSNWDFAFDCSHDKGIDWFEIKPEIKCDGRLMDEAAWQKVLSQQGVVEDDNCIKVLDDNSHKILNMIASMYTKDTSSKTDAKEIVYVPRLRILDWIYLRKSGVRITLPKEDEALIERLNRFKKIEERPIPDKLKAKLRLYQKDGYYWLSFLYEHRFGACLADDMGLGKTIQAITLLAGIKEGKVKPVNKVHGPHLIILPPSLLFNWENEIKRFYPTLKMHFYLGSERSTVFKGADVVLTTYGLIRRDIKKLKDIAFNVIVFDEAQAVKNIYTSTTGAVRQLNGYFKLTITGTPVENHLGEYYSILDLSLPGLLGKYEDIKSDLKTVNSPAIDLIIRRTRPFVLRRTKEKILKELPPKIETDIYLELTDRQKALYKRTVDMVKSTIADAYNSKTASQAKIIALTAILKLRQLCVSPKLIDPAIHEPSPKIEFLIAKLKELIEEGHSALVFSQFTSFLDVLETDLKKSGISFYRLDGSTPVAKRRTLIEGFQESKGSSIFLLSLKAGGQGLNLTKASYVFHLDPWWNPAVENQASDRAHRIGQKNKVSIMRILMRHTIEEKMMELKKKKLSLYQAVMGSSSTKESKGVSVSRSDFDYLLG